MPERTQFITTELLNFISHMPSGNALELIVLKGHLLLEQQLDEIIRTIVAHGGLLAGARLTFDLRARLAQAMCWGQHENSFWEFIFALNSLRNDLAHCLGSGKIDAKLQRVMAAHEATLTPEEKAELQTLEAHDRLKHGILQTMGFLASYSTDAHMYRSRTDGIYEMLSKVSGAPAVGNGDKQG